MIFKLWINFYYKYLCGIHFYLKYRYFKLSRYIVTILKYERVNIYRIAEDGVCEIIWNANCRHWYGFYFTIISEYDLYVISKASKIIAQNRINEIDLNTSKDPIYRFSK